MKKEDIEKLFRYHRNNDETEEKFNAITNIIVEACLVVNETCEDSREKSLAITNLQNAELWASAAISLHDKSYEDSE